MHTESHEGLSDLLQRSPFAASACACTASHERILGPEAKVTLRRCCYGQVAWGRPLPMIFAQGHPSPAKQCVFTTFAATIRCGATVVSSRIETTNLCARRMSWKKPLTLLLVLHRRIQDTILSQLFVDLLLILGRRPMHGEPSEFFFHPRAF